MEILFDHCELRDIDPWDPSIRTWLYPNPIPDPMRNCTVSVKQISTIIDGQLFVDLEGHENAICKARCNHPNGDWSIKFGEWMEIENGTRPRCDVVEVNCQEPSENETMETFYQFLHAQIYRPE